jgi:hypothetical protein
MKAALLLAFSFLIITGSLMGQENRFKYKDKDLLRNKDLSDMPYRFRQIDPDFRLNIYNDLPAIIKSQRPESSQDSLCHNPSKNKCYEDFMVVEEYPGYSRFFGDIFIIKPETAGGKLLVIKPVTSAKYYLIIIDPTYPKLIR